MQLVVVVRTPQCLDWGLLSMRPLVLDTMVEEVAGRDMEEVALDKVASDILVHILVVHIRFDIPRREAVAQILLFESVKRGTACSSAYM